MNENSAVVLEILKLCFVMLTVPLQLLNIAFSICGIYPDLMHSSVYTKSTCGSCGQCYTPGHLVHIFLFFLTDMYLYNHMTLNHMTAYLYNRAILPGTPLFPSFVCPLLFSSYGSL